MSKSLLRAGMLIAWLLSLPVMAEPPLASPAPVLGADDLAWVGQQEALAIGVRVGQVPLAFETQGGELAGTYIDYLERLSAKLMVPVREVTGSTEQLDQWLADGKIDAQIVAIVPGQALADGLLATKALMTLTYGVFVDAGDASVRKLADLERRRIALIEGDRNQFVFLEPIENFVPVSVANVSEAVSMVMSGQADAFIGPVPVVTDYLQAALINSIGLAVLLDGQAVGVVLEVKADQPQVHRVLNQAVESISHNEHRSIRQSWLPFVVPKAGEQRDVELSNTEQDWLKRSPALRVGLRSDWPPLEFREDGQFRGLAADLLTSFENDLGVKFNRIEVKSLAKAQEQLSKGELDILPSLTQTPQLEGEFLFSRPYLSLPIVLVIRDDGRFIGELRELRDERVGVVRGEAGHSYLLINHPNLNLFPVPSVESGLLALSNGDLDVMVTQIPAVSYTVARLGLSNLRITSITPYQYELRLVVAKNCPELLRLANSANAARAQH